MPRTLALLAIVAALVSQGCRQVAGIQDIQLSDGSSDAAGHPIDASEEAFNEGSVGPGCDCPGCAVLASALDLPLSLVVYDSYVYFTSYGPENGLGALMRVPSSGGKTETVVANLDRPFSLTRDATQLYWQAEDTTGGVVVTSPLSKPGAWRALARGLPTLKYLESMGGPALPTNAEIAVTATNVYFVGFATGKVTGAEPLGVLSVPIDGGAVSTLISQFPVDAGAPDGATLEAGTLEAGPGLVPLGIVTDGKTLFATSFSPSFAIVEAALPAGPVRQLIGNLDYPWALALGGNEVFFSVDAPNLASGSLQSIPVGGGFPTTLLKDGAAWMIVPDGDVLYFIDANLTIGSASIRRFDAKKKQLVTLASMLGAPQALAVDAQNVYWVDPYCGSLFKVPK